MDLLALSNELLYKLTSFLFFSLLYVWCTVYSRGTTPEWCSRVLSLLHGGVATLVGVTQCRIRTLQPSSFTGVVRPIQHGLMVWSWGYFAFDLLWCILSTTESNTMVIHHFIALAGITMYMEKPMTGCAFACTLAMTEMTNPLLQSRWFLRYEGFDNTKLYKCIEILYLLMFVFIRGVVGTYTVYKVFTLDVFDYREKTIGLALYVVSLAFIYDMYGFVMYKYKSKIIKRLNIFG